MLLGAVTQGDWGRQASIGAEVSRVKGSIAWLGPVEPAGGPPRLGAGPLVSVVLRHYNSALITPGPPGGSGVREVPPREIRFASIAVRQVMLTPFAKAASAYRAYLGSPHGRLRLEVIWHQLAGFLQAAWGREAVPRRILDVGCGPGELPLRLAAQGHAVTLLDPVEEMLGLAEERVRALAPPPAIPPVLILGSLEEAPGRVAESAFDLVLCHTLLEYLPEPGGALVSLRKLLAPGGHLSLVALNRWQEPFRLAVRDGDLEGARRALAGDGPRDAVFDLPRSGLERERLTAELAAAGITVLTWAGVFVFADYLPARSLEEPGSRERLLRLELDAGARAPFGEVSRYLHLWGRRP